jgi:hypothetical protein
VDGEAPSTTDSRGATTGYACDFVGAVTNIDYSDATPDVSLACDRLGRRN